MLIQACELPDPGTESLRDLLRMAGFAGPWQSNDEPRLRIVEHGPVTLLSTSPEAETMIRSVERTAIEDDPATASLSPCGPNKRAWRFALRGPGIHSVRLPGCQRAQPVLRAAGSTQPIGMTCDYNGHSALILGFSITSFLQSVRRNHLFSGYGHVCRLLEWFFEERAGFPSIAVSPWPDGHLPLLISFDVEAAARRRSLGRTILGIPWFNRKFLVQCCRGSVARPVVTSRFGIARNTLKDPDGEFPGYRAVIDLRRSPVGRFAKSWHVSQWQLQFLIPKDRDPVAADYADFLAWTQACLPRALNFLCGSAPPGTSRQGEFGFHSWTHEHFRSMTNGELRQELSRAAERFFPAQGPRAIRAPGLLWSSAYFGMLGEFGIDVDSSFRELNAYQPIRPILADAGWCELPVQGNLCHFAAVDELAQAAVASGSPLSMYAHDHDLTSAELRGGFLKSVARLGEHGFAMMGPCELARWMSAARQGGLSRINRRAQGWSLEGRFPQGTVLRLRSGRPPRAECPQQTDVWKHRVCDVDAPIVFTGLQLPQAA